MRWPTPLEVCAGILALFLIVGALATFDPFGRRKHAEAAAQAAVTQSHVSEAATQAVDHYTEHTTIIRERADRAVDQIQSAPGADTPVPPDVLREWRDGLRDISPGSGDPHSGKP